MLLQFVHFIYFFNGFESIDICGSSQVQSLTLGFRVGFVCCAWGKSVEQSCPDGIRNDKSLISFYFGSSHFSFGIIWRNCQLLIIVVWRHVVLAAVSELCRTPINHRFWCDLCTWCIVFRPLLISIRCNRCFVVVPFQLYLSFQRDANPCHFCVIYRLVDGSLQGMRATIVFFCLARFLELIFQVRGWMWAYIVISMSHILQIMNSSNYYEFKNTNEF